MAIKIASNKFKTNTHIGKGDDLELYSRTLAAKEVKALWLRAESSEKSDADIAYATLTETLTGALMLALP